MGSARAEMALLLAHSGSHESNTLSTSSFLYFPVRPLYFSKPLSDRAVDSRPSVRAVLSFGRYVYSRDMSHYSSYADL